VAHKIPTTLTEFTSTLAGGAPPAVIPALVALWHDAKGEWSRAHEVAQDIDDPTGAWVHAYLHRKEGDEGNAAYWYKRASKPVQRGALDAEWQHIVSALLSG
jgi:hypothetical protein